MFAASTPTCSSSFCRGSAWPSWRRQKLSEKPQQPVSNRPLLKQSPLRVSQPKPPKRWRKNPPHKPMSHLPLLLPVPKELLQVPVSVLLLQPPQAQGWGLQGRQQGWHRSLV